MHIKKLLLLLMIIALSFSTGCKQKQNEQVDTDGKNLTSQDIDIEQTDTFNIGEIINTAYKNNYFGLTIDIPESLYIADAKELEDLNQQNIEMGADIYISSIEKDMQLDEAKKIYEDYTQYCLLIHDVKPTPTDPGDIQFLIQSYNTNTDIPNAAKTTADFLANVEEDMRINWGEGEFSEIESVSFGTKQFDTLEAVFNVGEVKITQKVFVTKIKDYLLVFNKVYNSLVTQDNLDMLNSILDNVHFSD